MSQRVNRRLPENETQPTWRERAAALRYVPPFLKLVWGTHRGYATAIIILRLLRAALPVASLWIGKLIIDGVIAAREVSLTEVSLAGDLFANAEVRRLAWLVLLEIAIVVSGDTLARISALIEGLLGDLFSNYTSVRLMEHAATLDLYQFENPNFYDVLERARRQTTGRIGLLAQLLTLAQDAITLVSLSAGLLIFNKWLLLLLIVSVLPGFISATRFAALEYSLLYRWTPERRWLDYLRFLGASDRTAKEVQVFGLADWIIERYRSLSTGFYEANKQLSIRKSTTAIALSILGTLGYYAAYVLILLRAVQGAISIGTLTFLAASFARSRDSIERLLLGTSDIYRQCLYLKDLFDFFEMRPTITSKPDAIAFPVIIKHGFRFEDVGFRYPDSEQWAIRNLTFELRAGERIALVGENGAGKTTLTKLIARLYEPTEGRITLDGRDLRDYDLASLRQSVSVIFQDFVRYDLAFDANIGVGEIETVKSYLDANTERDTNKLNNNVVQANINQAQVNQAQVNPTPNAALSFTHGNSLTDTNDAAGVPQSIVDAADKSLATSLLPRFAKGFRQMLGRRFDGGVDLSGGEWQKVALGRAYMRDAPVLILDEPTAALDARAESEVFTRFSELIKGRTAILISHRFSTVRMADRIIVLAAGRIVEQGTHAELVALNGTYAELFHLQAAGYK